ncbi:hypothetical protein [Paraburkholderia caribensis]|uniref:hypothetical protein n=1 Tax=Paraburkholderia caribensis TaxID=75105 RepID=UPI0011DF34B3|nr:hypothetical protein [Paraburkholderia caribensis]
MNGIWLCQICSKLIDSDLMRFTSQLLHQWKRDAEFDADVALTGRHAPDYLPQPASAVHAPLPRIAGLIYHDARSLLVGAGWQPRMRHHSHVDHPEVRGGNVPEFWSKGYWEIENAWPTGLAQCTFAFHDVYGNFLTVVTLGEEHPGFGYYAQVTNWFFTKEP